MPFASPQSEPACLLWSDLLAQMWSEEAILGKLPGLSPDDIRACLNYRRLLEVAMFAPSINIATTNIAVSIPLAIRRRLRRT